MSKGKQPQSSSLPLPNPAAGSANPAQNLSSLWGFMRPALDHMMHGPTNDNTKAPAIQVDYYSRIHSHTYNYFTAQSESSNPLPLGLMGAAGAGGGGGGSGPVSGSFDQEFVSGLDLYEQIDKYYAEIAKESLLGAPQDDSTLIHYLIPCFNRYSAGAQSINRLLNYVNRHFVKRAVDEDKGWLRLTDVYESVAKTFSFSDTRDQVAQKMKDKKTDELRKWGYKVDAAAETLPKAEAAAEAASSLDRVVPLVSLAHRRFRTEFIDTLLIAPRLNGGGKKAKKKLPKPSSNGAGPPVPKGRLARAVSQLLDTEELEEKERRRLATELARCLWTVGVKHDHVVRKKLDKYVSQHPPFPPEGSTT